MQSDDDITALRPPVGTLLASKYEIIEELGKGGGGTVYRGRRIVIGDEVAIKVLHDRHFAQPQFRDRFLREARAAAKIHHPNVVAIYDFSEGDGNDAPTYLVMELVKGESLDTLLKRERQLEPERAVLLMREICSGVGAVHGVGVFHRDLKPSNLIILSASSESTTESVKIIDFGVARFKDVPLGQLVTEIGTVIGTPLYMSPEQCRGEPSDARSDVYSLGVILYEMIVGHPPFTASHNVDIVAMHLNSIPPKVESHLGVAPELESVLMRALSKEPDKRQMDASVLSEELKNALIHQRVLKIDAAHAGASDSSKALQYEIVEKPQLDIPNAEQQEWPGANRQIESEGQAVHLDGAGASLNKRFIGIDLGTTNTSCGIAELSAEGRITYCQLPIPQLQIDPNSGEVFRDDNSTILPSTVWLAEDNNVFTGALCVEYADIISEQPGSKVVHGIKSELANRHWKLDHNEQEYRPAEISSILLRSVWEAIEAKNFPEIDGIIITIPSSFSSTMRRETLRAARMAGLPMDKVSLLDEPIAAIFSGCENTNDPFPNIQTEQPILVFDMGGGTVDVSVLEIRQADRRVVVLSTSRYNQVAGDDLDLEIAAYLWRRLSVTMSPTPSLTRSLALALLHAGEAVKVAVNNQIASVDKGTAKDLSIRRRKSDERLSASFDLLPNSTERQELSIPIADVLDLVLPFIAGDGMNDNFGRNIFTPIEQALKPLSKDLIEDISQVYLVGGGAKFRPVYLELKIRSNNLSQALDATYAVSEGAARYAAAAHSGWDITETTSERIYLRRNRDSFLEILPDKLAIPSDPTPPPKRLEGNDTIELQKESRYLRLEFFQGSQANDPQMSPVYAATLSYEPALKQGTEMDSLVGHIDKYKIYRFEIGLKDPDGRRIPPKTVEFQAGSEDRPSKDRGPTYELNNEASLARVFQREPLRSHLSTRGVNSPVRFLSTASSEPPQLTSGPLDRERNAILKAMNESWADAYIGDKFLPTRLRATLAALQNLIITPGEAPTEAPHLELVELYGLYDITVIRSLLDHSYLLYGTTDLKGKLSLVVDQLVTDLTQYPDRVHVLLADLNEHADSAFDVSRELVEIFLSATANIPGIYDSIVNNPEFCAPFKLIAARLLGDPSDAPERLLKLLKLQLKDRPRRDDFDWKVRPTIQVLANTGSEGFQAALRAFDRQELGTAGALVLGSFEKEFGNWAVAQDVLSARYVPAVFQALFRMKSRTLLDKLVFRLLDEWYLYSEVKRKVDDQRTSLGSPKIYGRLIRKETMDLVESLNRGSGRDFNLAKRLEQAAIKRDDSFLLSLRYDERLADAIAAALVNSVNDLAAAFLIDFFTSRGNLHFRDHLLGCLLRRNSFKKLIASRQRLILEWSVTKKMASLEMLQGISDVCEPDLRLLLDKMIDEKYQARR